MKNFWLERKKDNSPASTRRWKRMEFNSSCGVWLIFKDDNAGCGDWALEAFQAFDFNAPINNPEIKAWEFDI